jgi:amino acid permease
MTYATTPGGAADTMTRLCLCAAGPQQAVAPASRPLLLPGSSLMSPMVFVLVSMLSTAYIAHYNAPKFYQELEDRSIPKLNKVVAMSFSFCAMVLASMMGFGFLTFGKASQGLILNNYAKQDMLAKACRVAIGSSIIFGYPLTFVGIRDGVLGLAGVSGVSTSPF